ncbi:hypothetical protein DAI22_03g127000 [Oryza sativa Japonica Group]|nr:hypothetical protein DAI22_03g127000 [Oryza sativa Japonica Group]
MVHDRVPLAFGFGGGSWPRRPLRPGKRTNETGGTKRRVRAPSLKCFECHMRPCVLGGDANYWLPLRCAAWILDGSPWMGFWMRGGPQATRGESLPPKFG